MKVKDWITMIAAIVVIVFAAGTVIGAVLGCLGGGSEVALLVKGIRGF